MIVNNMCRATTYERVNENATAAIIFARFELAINTDRAASFMPVKPYLSDYTEYQSTNTMVTTPTATFEFISNGIMSHLLWIRIFCQLF